MKKSIIKAFISVLCAFAVFAALTGCSGSSAGGKIIESSEGLVIIEATSTGGSLKDAMDALAEEGELTFEGEDGDYGFYILSVNGYTPDASANEYWAIYTTLGEYEGVSYSDAGFGSYDYGGRTCASASYGASGLIMVEGEIYVLAVASY